MPKVVRSALRVLGTLLTFALLSSSAMGEVINFDDQPCCGDPGTPPASLIPNGYHGLNWSNVGVTYGALNPPATGWHASVISPPKVAYNGYGLPMSFSTPDGSTFTFVSAYITSIYRDGMSVDISGYRQGAKVNELVIIPSATSATLYSFNWTGIDQVTFSASGGTVHPGYVDPYGQPTFGMDDLTIVRGAPTLTLTLDPSVVPPSQEKNPKTPKIDERLEQIIATVTLSGAPTVSGLTVDITADPDDLTSNANGLGGHDHFTSAAAISGDGFGDFHSTASGSVKDCADSSGNPMTDSSGQCSATLLVPRFSGRYKVRATLRGQATSHDEQTVNVAVEYTSASTQFPGISMTPLQPNPNRYVLTGAASQARCGGGVVESQHVLNHYGAAILLKDLQQIANDFSKTYNLAIRINDISVPGGGVFDFNNDWSSNAHAAHRYGVNADIEFNAGDAPSCTALGVQEINNLRKYIRSRTGKEALCEGPDGIVPCGTTEDRLHLNNPSK